MIVYDAMGINSFFTYKDSFFLRDAKAQNHLLESSSFEMLSPVIQKFEGLSHTRRDNPTQVRTSKTKFLI